MRLSLMGSEFTVGRHAFNSREDIFYTAERLSAAGVKVTAAVVMDALRGGDIRNIHAHLQEWEALRRDPERPVPMAMPDDIKAASLAATAIQLRRRIESLEAECKTARKKADSAEAVIARLQGQVEALESRNQELTQALAAIQKQSSKARNKP